MDRFHPVCHQLKGHQRISYQLLLIIHFSRPTVFTLKILLITCQHVMYLNHLCRLIITLWSFFNDQVSDSPQEKCQQKRIRSFEVASRQRIDCQKDDLLLNSLLCNDSPSSVSKTSLCESVSIVCHDNIPLNSHSAVPKQRNHCKTSYGIESKSIHYSIHPSGSVLNPIIAENVKEKSVKYWLKDLGLTMDDYCLIMEGKWLTDRHIDIFNNLLIKTFPKQNGLQSSIILSHYRITALQVMTLFK